MKKRTGLEQTTRARTENCCNENVPQSDIDERRGDVQKDYRIASYLTHCSAADYSHTRSDSHTRGHSIAVGDSLYSQPQLPIDCAIMQL